MKKIFSIMLTLFVSNILFAQQATLELPPGCKENYFTTSDNVSLRYVVAGKGEALIFIPGWTMPAEIWEKQLLYFSKTHMVIAVDPRSQGKSAKTREGLYFEREAKDFKELADHLKLSAYYLVGWSWAGPMIFTYLRDFNETALKGVAIVDAPFKFSGDFMVFVKTVIKGLLHDRTAITAAFSKGLFAQPQTDDYIRKVGNASMMTPTSDAIALLANFYVYDDSEWVKIIRANTKPMIFIAADGKQPLYQELNKEVKVSYAIIPGAGHTVFVDKPDEFNKILLEFTSQK